MNYQKIHMRLPTLVSIFHPRDEGNSGTQLMWWWLAGFWLGSNILFLAILCLPSYLERRRGIFEKASSQQAEVDHAAARLLLASAIVATSPEAPTANDSSGDRL